VQHPELSRQAIDGFVLALDAAPTSCRAAGLGVAVWDDAILSRADAHALAARYAVDAALVPMQSRLSDYRLLALDMDSTLITIECIDEIADYAGRKAEVAAITEAAMRGEIADFDESLRRRVALLAGLDEGVLDRVFGERLRLSPGASDLLAAARMHGLKTLLVSGGFTYFTERLRADLGLDFAQANTLEVVDGKLTGRVVGRILNAQGKAQALRDTCSTIGCTPAEAIVLGDGANDLKMLALAGVSVAYRAKAIVQAQTRYAINYCGLDAVVNLVGGDGGSRG
jgi:phosphoserine phosphatase